MLEASYGLNFFLKSPKNKTIQIRYVYLRVTVDGVPKEISTKMKWDARRWDQEAGRAIGTKEDAKTLNFYLEALITKISRYVSLQSDSLFRTKLYVLIEGSDFSLGVIPFNFLSSGQNEALDDKIVSDMMFGLWGRF